MFFSPSKSHVQWPMSLSSLQNACQPGPPPLSGALRGGLRERCQFANYGSLLGMHSRIVNLVAGAIMVLGGISQFFPVTM